MGSYNDGDYLFDNDANSLQDGFKEQGVISGCEVTVDTGLTVNISSGRIIYGSEIIDVSSTSITLSTADATNPRKDIIVVNSSGTVSKVDGVPATADPSGNTGRQTSLPKASNIPSSSIILAEIWVGIGTTSLTSSDITDLRQLHEVDVIRDSIQYSTDQSNPTLTEGLTFYDNTKDSLSYYNSTGIINLTNEAEDIAYSNSYNYFNSSNVEDLFDEIGETMNRNGYDLTVPASLPDLAFDNSTRTFTVSVKSGSSNFYFWVNNKKITKTSDQTITIPDVTGTYYIYFDDNGTLQYINYNSISNSLFYEYAITGLVYWNATAGTSIVGNELHGISMDGRTHQYNHNTFGARYERGMDIEGLTSGGTTYTQTTSGFFWDEDIKHTISSQTTHSFLYRYGTNGEWVETTADNKVSYNNGGTYDVWNEWDGSTWKLSEGTTSTDFWIIFYIVTPEINGKTIKKLIGQNAYGSRANARNAIETEMRDITTNGLPTPEFVFLYATIVKRDGTLQTLADGSLYLDLRYLSGGAGGVSNPSSWADDVIVNTTNFDGNLSSSDTTVQLALDTIDDVDFLPTGVQGDVLYHNGTSWVVLNAGTSGQYLQTKGSGANPVWADASGSGTVTNVSAGNGMDFTDITTTGNVVLGTPSEITSTTTNSVTSTSHTHALNDSGVTAGSYTSANITVDAKGRITSATDGSSGGSGNPTLTFSIDGELSTGTKTYFAMSDEFNGLDLKEVRISVMALPSGSSLKVDVRKNGTATTDSIFTSDVPIEIGTSQSATNGIYQVACDISGARVGTPGTTIDSARDSIASDDILYIVVTQVGSSTTGADFRLLLTFG